MGKRSRILVVDDDCALLDIAEEIIGDCYDVILAQSGVQALEILSSQAAPELILLDIDMPGMDGFETLNHIRKKESLSMVPVVFLTGITDSTAELAGLSHGAQDYITKPFARDNLLTRIRLRLESGLQARQLQEMRKQFISAGWDETRFAVLTKDLTPSECEVARLIVQGYDNQGIARRLNYSTGYVKNLATLIYSKLEIRGRVELRTLIRK